MHHFLITFYDPAKRGPQTAAVLGRTRAEARARFARRQPDLTVLSVSL